MFDSAKFLIYLKKNSLEVYKKGTPEPAILEVPATAVFHQEIQNPVIFEKALASFVQGLGVVKQRAIILLSSMIVYQKTVDATNDQPIVEQQNNFFDDLPLEPDQKAIKIINLDKQIYLLATNKEIYQKVIDAFESVDWRIEAIIPATLIGDYPPESFLPEDDVKHILSNSKLHKETDFMADNQKQKNQFVEKKPADSLTDDKSGDEKKDNNLTKILLLGLAIIIFFGGVGFFAWNQGYIQKLLKLQTNKNITVQNNNASPSASLTKPSNESTRSATTQISPVQDQPKDKLKVQIINGSGVAGQASSVKDLLSEIGYDNFELGNASDSADITKITYSKIISTNLKEELVRQLKKLFTKIASDEASTSSDFDISITTGK